MAALTKDRQTVRRDSQSHSDPVAAGVRIFSGSMVVLNSNGFASPGATATGLTTRGIAEHGSNNLTGPNGAGDVRTLTGAHQLANAGDITRAHIGTNAYIDDDQTVTADSSGRSIAGRIDDVDSNGVWVQFA